MGQPPVYTLPNILLLSGTGHHRIKRYIVSNGAMVKSRTTLSRISPQFTEKKRFKTFAWNSEGLLPYARHHARELSAISSTSSNPQTNAANRDVSP